MISSSSLKRGRQVAEERHGVLVEQSLALYRLLRRPTGVPALGQPHHLPSRRRQTQVSRASMTDRSAGEFPSGRLNTPRIHISRFGEKLSVFTRSWTNCPSAITALPSVRAAHPADAPPCRAAPPPLSDLESMGEYSHWAPRDAEAASMSRERRAAAAWCCWAPRTAAAASACTRLSSAPWRQSDSWESWLNVGGLHSCIERENGASKVVRTSRPTGPTGRWGCPSTLSPSALVLQTTERTDARVLLCGSDASIPCGDGRRPVAAAERPGGQPTDSWRAPATPSTADVAGCPCSAAPRPPAVEPCPPSGPPVCEVPGRVPDSARPT